jgi:hypothetical protein
MAPRCQPAPSSVCWKRRFDQWEVHDIGRYRQVIGDGLHCRKDKRRVTEVAVAIHVSNRMLDLGRPISVRIA